MAKEKLEGFAILEGNVSDTGGHTWTKEELVAWRARHVEEAMRDAEPAMLRLFAAYFAKGGDGEV